MQQTILALGALMIIMMTALNHQRSVMMIQEMSYVRELENAALDISKLRIEEILNDTGFDELWLGETTLPTSATSMTSSNSFGPDGGETTFDDVDDYHYFVENNIPHAIGADTFRFNISYTVSYVNTASGDTTSTQTFAKMLTANTVSTDSIGTRVARATWSKTTIVSEDI